MIKPDDVPKSLVYDVYAQMKKCLELDELGTPVSTEQQISDLLNLCIEAGVVSPPCWVYRYTGELQKSGGVVDLFPKRHFTDDQFGHHEHWKGQTE